MLHMFCSRCTGLGTNNEEVIMDEKKLEINRTLNAVIATIYLLYKVHILTNKHVKDLLKAIETDKEPLAILKELKDIASEAND